MHNEISESFWLGVETLASVILLVLLIAVGNTSRQLSDIMEQQKATETLLQEVREWQAYDNRSGLYEADVLSVYYKYGSSSVKTPKVIKIVNDPDGEKVFKDTNAGTYVDSNTAMGYTRPDRTYSCKIERDTTQVVVSVIFTLEPA